MVSIKPIPDGYHTLTPYLIVSDVNAELNFIERALGGTVLEKIEMPDGFVGHAEAQIGDSRIMFGARPGVQQIDSSTLYVYLPEVDHVYQRALEAGAESVQEPQNQFYGDRSAAIKDPHGNRWYLATHIEDVPRAELQRRMIAARTEAAKKKGANT